MIQQTSETTPGWEELLEVAVLAPSAQNSQPWRFAVVPGGVDVFADRTRSLPAADPYDRELAISCGAAAAFLAVAATGRGLEVATEVLPDPRDPDLLVRVRARGPRRTGPEDLALLAATTRRRTVRQPFTSRPVAERTVTALVATAEAAGARLVPLDAEAGPALAALVAEADRRQAADLAVRRELAAWLRPDGRRRDDGIPGAALGLGPAASHLAPLAVRLPSTGARQAATDRALLAASPLVAVLATDGDHAVDWVTAGLALGRVLLRATVDELAASFLNAPVQVPALRPRLAVLAGLDDASPQVVVRLGHGPPGVPSPRRPASAVTRTEG